jgi:uncharacterized protein
VPFLGVRADRGERVHARVPFAEFSDGSPVTIPVAVINGARPGPTFYLQAGLHGDELTGIEICRRVLAELDPKRMAGTVVSIPTAHIPAYLGRTRGFLHEERWLIDINRIFPGNPRGLMTERLAHILLNEFVIPAEFSLDLHSALDGCTMTPFVYIDPDDDEGGTLAMREKLGRAFGTPLLYYKKRGEKLGTSVMTGSLRTQSEIAGRPMFSAEMGESRRVSHEFVSLGVRGVHNVLRTLGIEEGDPEPPGPQRIFRTITLVHADHGGGLRTRVALRDEVKAGQLLAEIVDVFGDVVERITSPVDGFIQRLMLLGSVATGAEIVWIGS